MCLGGNAIAPERVVYQGVDGFANQLIGWRHQPGDYQFRPYFDKQYLKTLTHLLAGRSLNVLVDLLSEIPREQGFEIEDP